MASHSLFAPLFAVLILYCVCVTGRSIKNNELSDIFYSEIRNLLNQQIGQDTIPVQPREVQGWPRPLPHLGQVTGVAINPSHQPVIFHRGPRVWDETTFNETHHFQHIAQGPISVDTLLTLDPDTGEIIGSWGNNFFYLPHGLTIDNYGYYYMTDVGLHQAFKFKPGSKTPSLTFGQKFEPGSGLHHLCKPTDVAVATTGEIFVADGYCNSRVLKYDSNGNLLHVLPRNQEFLSLRVPHSITLLEDLDLLCIADRENMRVVCPRAGLKGSPADTRPVLTTQQPDMGRVFAVAAYRNQVFAVNGPTIPMIQVRGFTIDPVSETVEDQWSPVDGFQNPHDLEVCHNTSSLYVTETGPNRIWKFHLNRLY